MGIKWIKDNIGRSHIGIEIPDNIIDKFKSELRDYIDNEKYFNKLINTKLSERSTYFIDVMGHSEIEKMVNSIGSNRFLNLFEKVSEYRVKLLFKGIGLSKRDNIECYYIVCESKDIDNIRNHFNLDKKELYIDIGYYPNNLENIEKNNIIKTGNKFLKLLRSNWIKEENFNFLSKIGFEPIPISISDSYLKITDGEWIYDIGLDDNNNEFKAFTKYKKTYEKRLPKTEIIKIFNEI